MKTVEKKTTKRKYPGNFVRMSEALSDAVTTIAAREDRTLSSTIRKLLTEAVEARRRDADLAARLQRDQENRVNNQRVIE